MRKSTSAGSVSRQQLQKLASKSAMDLRMWLKGGLQKQAEEELPLYEGQRSGRSFALSGSIKTLVIVLTWYASNIGVLLANKAILSNYKYKYPIFLTLLHMLACTLYSLLFIKLLKLVPYQPLSSRTQMLKISGLSLIFCLSVVAGNVSLRFLPVSFNQAIGATGPFFTALFAVLMTWKTEPMAVYATLIPIVLGIVIASGGEPLFNLFGFLMCLTSTSARACKSVLQGILLSSDSEKLNSMNLLMYMAPIACAALLPASLLMEGNVLAVTLQKGAESPRIFAYLAGNMTMAYLVNLMNFIVTKHTSALTLQVLGNAKAALAVVISVAIFRNPVTLQGLCGFALTLLGVVLYSEAKKRTKPR